MDLESEADRTPRLCALHLCPHPALTANDSRSQQMDFFKDLVPGTYSICYDYTFFCAIPPALRADWGKAYAKGIRSGGVLITMMWPIGTLPLVLHFGGQV